MEKWQREREKERERKAFLLYFYFHGYRSCQHLSFLAHIQNFSVTMFFQTVLLCVFIFCLCFFLFYFSDKYFSLKLLRTEILFYCKYAERCFLKENERIHNKHLLFTYMSLWEMTELNLYMCIIKKNLCMFIIKKMHTLICK